MAKKKSTASIDAEITRIKSDMSKLQDKYNRLSGRLKELEDQKRRIETETIMDVYLESGKSFDEIMTFLNP